MPLLSYHPRVNTRTTAVSSEDLTRFVAACGHRPILLELAGLDP